METLKIKLGDTYYLLFNLSSERSRELLNDPQILKTHTENCMQTGTNICVLENGENFETLTAEHGQCSNDAPTPSASVAGSGKKKFSFLCGSFEEETYIYAIKLSNRPWHYFHELDTPSSQHDALPSSRLDVVIASCLARPNKVLPFDINLTENQSANYFSNDQFIFKNETLKTHSELTSKCSENCQSTSSKGLAKKTTQLVFVSGETNPLLFLNEFMKCTDLKTDKDKMYKIRNFVDECHKAEFSKLYFTSDWPTVRSAFLKCYSLSFVRNKKRELNIDFHEANSLRSFVERKLISLSKFTTLPFINQMEMVLHDLPVEISSLFITNEQMVCDKGEILDFCDSIEDLVETRENSISNEVNTPVTSLNKHESEPLSDTLSESMSIDEPAQSCRGRGRGRGKGRAKSGPTTGRVTTAGRVTKRGRPSKKLKPIIEEGEQHSSDYSFLNQVDDTSRSTWSDC